MTKSTKTPGQLIGYCTELAPGCYSGAYAPIVSRHRTLDAAIRKASGNDRLAVYELKHSTYGAYAGNECLFILKPQGDPDLGDGRYGNSRRTGRYSRV